VEISDNGDGIAEEDLDRVFEPFFSTRSDGLGLGLAIVHRIVTDHGGTIEIESQRGRGATVILSFPALEKDS
jgi:two-component system sensor histidine kinase HydH